MYQKPDNFLMLSVLHAMFPQFFRLFINLNLRKPCSNLKNNIFAQNQIHRR